LGGWSGDAPPDATYWQDVDDQVFVNYLSGTVEFEYDIGYPDVQSFERDGRVLTEKLTEYLGKPRLWSKYTWATHYHNAFLDLRPDFSDDARIDVAGLAGRLKAYQ